MNELKQQPDEGWLKSADKGDWIVTSQGQPVAVLRQPTGQAASA
jgi:hypothetical protein